MPDSGAVRDGVSVTAGVVMLGHENVKCPDG